MLDPFITEQNVVDQLGRGDPSDPGITLAVQGACDVVRTFTEQQLNFGTTTETYDGPGTDALLLPQFPVTNVDLVLVDGGTVTDWVLDTRKGAVVRKASGSDSYWAEGWWGGYYNPTVWPRGRQNVEVTFEHGYDTDDFPQDLCLVAIALATRVYVQGPVTAQTIGRQIAVTYGGAATDLTAGEQLVLNKYRRIGP